MVKAYLREKMEFKEAFGQLGSRLDKSLEEYNKDAGKKVMVIPKSNGESYYIFNRKTVVIRAGEKNPESITLEYYDGQKDVVGNAFDTAAEFLESEELTCFLTEEPFFSFTATPDVKKNTNHTVNAILRRIFRGRIE